jgi:single-strand selective monofunctional uracil DNA glycosylase
VSCRKGGGPAAKLVVLGKLTCYQLRVARHTPASQPVSSALVDATKRLSKAVSRLAFEPPVTHVYNPLDYAWAPHEQYLKRFGAGTGRTVLLGMNPGPFGMAQVGVPFGEVTFVKEWIGVDAPVGKPEFEHPARPITGFACTRSEVSGARLWGWAKQRFGTPEAFFARFFVLNYCPLVFMSESGANITPDKLPARERQQLFAACDEALRVVCVALQPCAVVGVGAFAYARAVAALAPFEGKLGQILHPSPASPKANAGWARVAEQQLRDLGVA